MSRRMFPVILTLALVASAPPAEAQTEFVRGDCNGDGYHDIADALVLTLYLFQGGGLPPCFAACDLNDDDAMDIADVATVLEYVLVGVGGPMPPFPACGVDPTPGTLRCDNYDCSAPAPPAPAVEYFLTISDGGGSVGANVAVQCLLDSFAGEPVYAWSWSVCHDDASLTLDGIADGASTMAVNSGAGPDVNLVQVFPGEGWSVGVMVSIVGAEALAPAGDHELHVASYVVTETSPTVVSYCGTLGDPDIGVVLSVGGASVLPTTADGVVNGTPPPPQFRRGDADADGTFNGLVDALFLLAFQFTGGPMPPCLDAADADDDGAVSGLVDSLLILAFQFQGGPAPADPGPNVCGSDPTDDALGCETPPVVCP